MTDNPSCVIVPSASRHDGSPTQSRRSDGYDGSFEHRDATDPMTHDRFSQFARVTRARALQGETSPTPRSVMRHAAFISTPAKLDTCPRCAELILAAIVDGFDTLADPYAVEAAGELICRLAGRASFVAEIAPHSLLLYCRHAEHIRYSDPRPVLVQHACLSPPSAIDQRETQRVLGVFINADEITYSENPPF